MTNRAYSGCNVPLLWATAQERGYESSKWLTFKQALDAGGNVRKGEKGSLVVYVSSVEKTDEETGKIVRIPFLKAFTVFNVSQCDGLTLAGEAPRAVNPHMRNGLAEEFIASTGATVTHGEGRAYYRPSTDSVNLPRFETFVGASEYYSTAFHELTHWTGAEKRLNRTFGKRFGDCAYSAEELVAELGSAFLCAEFGFDNDVIDNQAAYLAHWIKALTDHESLFVAAASKASQAVEFTRGLAISETADETISEAA
jgi:antirestriction protein ArdC